MGTAWDSDLIPSYARSVPDNYVTRYLTAECFRSCLYTPAWAITRAPYEADAQINVSVFTMQFPIILINS